jgi:hypothetical protein
MGHGLCVQALLTQFAHQCRPRVFLLIYVVYSLAWMLYLKSSPQIATPMEGSDSSSKWVLVSSALALAALGALWLPGKGFVLVHAKDPESLNIEMWRTDCQIRCPVSMERPKKFGATPIISGRNQDCRPGLRKRLLRLTRLWERTNG